MADTSRQGNDKEAGFTMMRLMSTYMTKKSWIVSLLVVGSVAVAAPSVARAADDGDGTGFVELAVGQMSPMGDKQWDDVNESAFKFALHGGVWARRGMGFELALDYTPLDSS